MKEMNYDIPALLENLKTADDKKRAEIINKLSEDYNNNLPQLWSKAVNGDNPRAILSVLRDILKKEKPRGIFKRVMGNSKGKLSAFLQDSDPKVRKNACGIIGEMADADYLEALYTAYDSETQLFVRSSYVLAIGNCGDTSDAARLQDILEALLIKEKASEDTLSLVKNEKHIIEEKLSLTKVITKLAPTPPHTFLGFKTPVPMVLTAMDDQFLTTLKDLYQKSIKGSLVNDGILIREMDLDKVYSCRTFYELLYPLTDCKNLQFDYKVITNAIIKSKVVDLLKESHEIVNGDPFCYRVELNTMEDNSERSEFVKSLARELDELSSGSLKNSPSSYEVEIRIIEKKKLCSVFMKLYSFRDKRFDYREKVLAASINPITAAIVIKAIEKWLKPTAKVIDPFCGTGTMLVERAKAKDFLSLTGVDIYKAAIEAATINSTLANLNIALLAKDILEFSPLSLFDEMITNMPFESRGGANNLNKDLYSGFINGIPRFVRPGGMVFLYTVEKNLLKDCLIDNKQLKLIDEIKFESGGLTPSVFVLRVR
ncbi:MAG TPA: HEAT repeat domain-containing protein [Clostridiaceae bacterium]